MFKDSLDIFLEDFNQKIEPSTPLSKKEAKKSPIVRLDSLYPGQRFIIPSLGDYYKNLYVIRISSCSVTVKGEVLDEESKLYKILPKGFTMALSTSVKRI